MSASILNIVKKYANKALQESKAILTLKGKGTSKLKNSLKVNVVLNSDNIEVSFNANDYAKNVNEGRRPGKQPPLNVIEKWCNEKGINKKFAFPIAKKIGDKGIKPTNFLDPIYKFKEEVFPALIKTYKEELMKEVKPVKIQVK